MRVLVTGGAGFIGSTFLLRTLDRCPGASMTCLDALTYAANPATVTELARQPRIDLAHGDLVDFAFVDDTVRRLRPDLVVHIAAETHVDRSIQDPLRFVRSNVDGTLSLLEAVRRHCPSARFHHVSTDEVFGALGDLGAFAEDARYNPGNPYSATKAASDHLVRAYVNTHRLRATITHASNTYGPRQYPEKLIPLMLTRALEGSPLPVYGTGMQVRDWLHVDDHADAIWAVIERGEIGESYNVGSGNEHTNLDLVRALCRAIADATGRDLASLEGLITHVADRPGHDHRYALATEKIRRVCGFSPRVELHAGLSATVRWYLANPDWVSRAKTADFGRWLEAQYAARLAPEAA